MTIVYAILDVQYSAPSESLPPQYLCFCYSLIAELRTSLQTDQISWVDETVQKCKNVQKMSFQSSNIFGVEMQSFRTQGIPC